MSGAEPAPLSLQPEFSSVELQTIQAGLQELETLVLSDAVAAELQARILLAQVRRGGTQPDLEAKLLCVYAASLYFQSKIPESEGAYNNVIEISQKLHDKQMHVRALNGLGNVACLKGDYEQGMEYYHQSTQMAEQYSDEAGWQRASSNLAYMYARFGNHEDALAIHEELIVAAQRIGYTQLVVNARVNVIEDHLGMENHQQVSELSREFLQDPLHHEFPQYIAVVKSLYARSLLALGDHLQAQHLTEEALPILENLAYQEYQGHALLIRSEVERQLGEPELAYAAAQFALNIGNEFGLLPLQAKAHLTLAAVLESQEQYPQAIASLRRAHDIEKKLHAQQIRHGVQLTKMRLKLRGMPEQAPQTEPDAN